MNLVDIYTLAGDGNTVWPYWQRLDYADNLGPWCLVSDSEHKERKERWRDQYLPGLTLRLVDDIPSLAASGVTLLTPDLTLARIFAKAGGKTIWCDGVEFRDASGPDAEYYRRIVNEAINEALSS